MLMPLKQLSRYGGGAGQIASYDASVGAWGERGYVQYSELEASATTTSATFQQRLRMTTASDMPAGTYRLEWQHSWQSTSSSGDVSYRVQVDDATNVIVYEVETVVAGANNSPVIAGRRAIALTAGARNIDYDFRRITSGHTVTISLARLYLRWVAP